MVNISGDEGFITENIIEKIIKKEIITFIFIKNPFTFYVYL